MTISIETNKKATWYLEHKQFKRIEKEIYIAINSGYGKQPRIHKLL